MKMQIGLTSVIQACPGCPEKTAVTWAALFNSFTLFFYFAWYLSEAKELARFVSVVF